MSPFLIALVLTWLVLIPLALGLGLVLRRLKRLEKDYRRLMAGASAEGLENVLLEHVDQIYRNAQGLQHLQESVKGQQQDLQRAIQHMGLVHFNPFGDTGGQYSFALALVDAQGDGVVLCSLHGRNGTRVYAKALSQWEPHIPLGDEEREAVRRARETAGSRVFSAQGGGETSKA